MKIAIGCDHIVTDIKDYFVTYLKNKGHEVVDMGTYDFIRTHYPIYGLKVGLQVYNKTVDKGIVICGTGVGIINSAAKVPNVRAILARNIFDVKKARENLDINVLGIGGRIVGKGVIEEMIDVFLNTEYIETDEKNKLISTIDKYNLENIEKISNSKIFDDYIIKWEKGYYSD